MTKIDQLRSLTPTGKLDLGQLMHLAERQALALLGDAEQTMPPVSDELIQALELIHIERVPTAPVKGAAQWVGGRWVILINSADSRFEQRFSAAHELKHILDNPLASDLYRLPLNAVRGLPCQREELACDYFAGCFLVPAPWLERAWWSGTRDLAMLAATFDVPVWLVYSRLLQAGLVGSFSLLEHVLSDDALEVDA